MRTFLVLLLISCTVQACSPKLIRRYASEKDIWVTAHTPKADPTEKDGPILKGFGQANCGTWADYIPDTNHLDHFPIREIRINVHFMNTTDSASNYYGEEARSFVRGWLTSANKDLRENNPSWLPYHDPLPTIPTQYRLTLTNHPDYPENQGVYDHFDDELFYYIHRGKNRNLYDQRAFEKYGLQQDSVLNIFVMPHHPDSIASPTYAANGVGVAVGGGIKVAGLYETGQPAWAYRGILNHEVGHVFTLTHSWLNDGCPDTPYGKNPCWNRTKTAPCDTAATNNVMEYNALQNAWTPCQIGRIRMRMADENFRYRKFLARTWCQLDTDKTIIISDSVNWAGAKDLEGHLVIAETGYLRIECRVSLPAGAHIAIKPGGQLILGAESRLHNACNREWDGIIVEAEGRQAGQIIFEGKPVIENIRHALPPIFPSEINVKGH